MLDNVKHAGVDADDALHLDPLPGRILALPLRRLQVVRDSGKLHGVVQVVHRACVSVFLETQKHVQQARVQQGHTHLHSLLVHGFVLEVNLKGVPIADQAVGLKAVADTLELTTPRNLLLSCGPALERSDCWRKILATRSKHWATGSDTSP